MDRTSEQLKTLAWDLFKEIDTSGDDHADMDEITSFLDGAEISYDKPRLDEAFAKADENGDGKLSYEEFIECYKQGSIADVFCIPTKNRESVPHHKAVTEKYPEVAKNEK